MAINDWHDMMPHTIVHKTKTGQDSYNKPTYSSGTSIAHCRVNYRDFFFRKPDGSEVQAKGEVWLGTAVRISVQDMIVLPDGTDHPILWANSYSDEDGLHHTKVVFG